MIAIKGILTLLANPKPIIIITRAELGVPRARHSGLQERLLSGGDRRPNNEPGHVVVDKARPLEVRAFRRFQHGRGVQCAALVSVYHGGRTTPEQCPRH